MRIAYNTSEIQEAVESCKRESLKSFGDDRVLVEKYLQKPRHVEVQVFADEHGNCVYLFERDCSVQRRHQKIIEEAPGPGITPELRQRIGTAAVNAARAVGYRGAGTVEFIVENNEFFFMEMNTRLQVEHPITEMITRQDLVDWQIQVASGFPLPLKQEELKIHGHAFEARVYAENPNNDFLPGTGKLEFLSQPTESANVRVDTGVRQGDSVSVFYDPMIAKLVVWDVDRHAALRRLIQNLSQYHIAPLHTNLEFLIHLAQHPQFEAGNVHTGFIQEHKSELFAADTATVPARVLAIAKLFELLSLREQQKQQNVKSKDPFSPFQLSDGHRIGLRDVNQSQFTGEDKQNYKVGLSVIDGQFSITVSQTSGPHTFDKVSASLEGPTLKAHIDGQYITAVVFEEGEVYHIMTDQQHYKLTKQIQKYTTKQADGGSLKSPMPGRIIKQFVSIGDKVKKGQPLLILEAMKMEHKISSPADGTVKAIHFPVDSQVSQGVSLITIA